MMEKNANTAYFIGIGGIGMSALARYFLSQNWQVSGSDVSASFITQNLKKEGAKVYIGHQPSNLSSKTDLVVYSAAVSLDNSELIKAKKMGIATQTYAEAIGELTKKYKTIAIAGAHGKSTTTALLSLVFVKAGLDPTIIIGTNLKELSNRNFRKGNGQYLILEADEYQKSFLGYSPFAAIITNIDREHLDIYKNLSNIKNVFLKFINNIQPNGFLIVNRDDKNLFCLKSKIEKIARKNKLKIFWYGIKNQYLGHPMSQKLTRNFRTSDVQKLKKILKIPGDHNVSNALAAYSLAKALNIRNKDIFSAISKYRGAWRRMEYRGKFKILRRRRIRLWRKNLKFKIRVYDDYAHHPTEIRATLAGIAQKWPKTALICVFQPHQAQRVRMLFKEFIGAFNEADILVLLDVYKVAGRDTDPQTVVKPLSKQLADAINRQISKSKNIRLKKVLYLPYLKKLPQILNKIIRDSIQRQSASSPRESALLVMMGAGDIYKLTNNLI